MASDSDSRQAPGRIPSADPPSLRAAQKELAREKLINAAREAFEAKGYVDVRIDDITRRAGASRATFYVYFQSKADILDHVLRARQLDTEYREVFARLSQIDHLSVDALQAWLEESIDFYQKSPGLQRALHQAQVIEPEFANAFSRVVEESADVWISSGLIKPPISESLRVRMIMVFALSHQFLFLWLVQGIDVDRSIATRGLAESFCAMLRAE